MSFFTTRFSIAITTFVFLCFAYSATPAMGAAGDIQVTLGNEAGSPIVDAGTRELLNQLINL